MGHNHSITALAVALKQAQQPEFQVYLNCKVLANRLQTKWGLNLVADGTDNHMCLLDLKKSNTGVSGAKGERMAEICNIVLNKNTVPYDTSALNPSGLRIGTPAMTSRGLKEKDFEQVADFLYRSIEIAADIQKKVTSKKLVDFTKFIIDEQPPLVAELKSEVENFCELFPSVP